MGKIPLQQCLHLQNEDEASFRFFYHRCLVGIIQICQGLDLKCAIILVLSLSIFVFAFFWALPLHPVKTGFDAKDVIKLVPCMDSRIEVVEERLNSFTGQLQSECAILERIVYKNKNQHRRCSYFQYLQKVRRDLKLLQSANLEELLSSCFQVIHGKKPKQKVHLLESLKKRKCDGGKYNFMERLLGAAHLLSEMVEPMLKAAIEISTLLARSFFMGFSLTILALLARLRILVQQILLDVVSVFNTVSSLSQKEQCVKLTQAGIEVFREYYPTNEEFVTLECVWETDKFVLCQRIKKIETKNRDGDPREDVSLGTSTIQYQSIKALLADDELGSKKTDMIHISEEGPTLISEDKSLLVNPSLESDDGKQVEDSMQVSNGSEVAGSSSIKNLLPEHGLLPHSSSLPSSNPLKRKFGSSNKVAFVSVKRPTVSAATATFFPVEEIKSDNENKEDSFFSLLTDGNIKDSLF